MLKLGCKGRRWQCLFVISYLFVGGSSLSCVFPCNLTNCEALPRSGCPYGLVKDVCLCCTACGLGPGEECGDDIGSCGRGLECYKMFFEGMTLRERLTTPGVCRLAANASTTTDISSPPLPLDTTTASSVTANTPPPPVSSPRVATELPTNTSADCLFPTCSIDYCTGGSRQRICSAKGLSHSPVARRGDCQYTSCRACFFYIQPPCTQTCRELPTKQCLKRYYKCVDNFLLAEGRSSASLIQRLTDPSVRSRTGRIVCHIPEVSST